MSHFCSIDKLYGFGQYKMHSSGINVPTNVNQTQSILSCLSHDDVARGVFLKRHLEYKLLYMLGNVHPNMVMIALHHYTNI
jgi:hypothetical protein